MAPFRAGRSTRSGRPGGQTDQDIVDGLPIRQWRQQDTTLGAPQDEVSAQGDLPLDGVGRWMLLPMPKGSESYTPWCQQLLRAARAGRIPIAAKRYRGLDKDDDDDDDDSAAKGREKKIAKKEEHKGFSVKKWTQVPRNQEAPEPEYLAKRRKGLPSAIATALAHEATLGPMRRTKVRRVDAVGNVSIWDVLVPEGQYVEGEVESDLALETAGAPIEAPVPGTVIEGLGVANADGVLVATDSAITPLRRRGPPPRRKGKKGPVKGRNKLPKMTESAGMGVSASAEALAASRQRLLANGEGDDSASSIAQNTPGGTHTGEEDEADIDGEDGEDEDGDNDDDDNDAEDGEIEDEDAMDTRPGTAAGPVARTNGTGGAIPEPSATAAEIGYAKREPSEMEGVETGIVGGDSSAETPLSTADNFGAASVPAVNAIPSGSQSIDADVPLPIPASLTADQEPDRESSPDSPLAKNARTIADDALTPGANAYPAGVDHTKPELAATLEPAPAPMLEQTKSELANGHVKLEAGPPSGRALENETAGVPVDSHAAVPSKPLPEHVVASVPVPLPVLEPEPNHDYGAISKVPAPAPNPEPVSYREIETGVPATAAADTVGRPNSPSSAPGVEASHLQNPQDGSTGGDPRALHQGDAPMADAAAAAAAAAAAGPASAPDVRGDEPS